MTENTILPTDANGDGEDNVPARQPVPEDKGPTVPKPFDRPAEIDRKIRSAVERLLEGTDNPYEAVIAAAQEARRINERRLKARSVINQALEHVEEIVPEVPFVPRAAEDEEPEVKPTNEALEKLACGLVDYEIDSRLVEGLSYYPGEIDFPLYHEDEKKEESDKIAS
jgi:DNA-directed RNA polymerase subunit K/omega